jgi:hypothetical protein
MQRLFTSVCGLCLLLIPFCFAQDANPTIRVGVAVMENYAGRSVPGTVERDHLVVAINQLKPDKKTHVKVEAVPLQSMSAEDAQQEAQQQKCQYVVYTRLVELRSATDPYQPTPGTIETNPNSQWANRGGDSQIVDPEFRATVDYKLTSATGVTVAGVPFSTQSNTSNEIGTVSLIMDRIANAVAAEVKKGQPPMRE